MRTEEIDNLGTSLDIRPSNEKNFDLKQSHVKLLVLCENRSDIFMINKIFTLTEGYKIYEVHSLHEALKALNYLSFDLILVDDMLSEIDGYECVDKLNLLDVAKHTPKIILLTEDYKLEKKENFQRDNVDFVKKPFDATLFKLRVKSLLTISEAKCNQKSYFNRLSHEALNDAASYMSVYQDIFQQSEKMMCLYDAAIGEVVEANAIFEKFFSHPYTFNRIMKHERMAQKFVPYMDEVNYLNHYKTSEWISTLLGSEGMSYMVKIKQDFKEYSFHITLQEIEISNRIIYVVKFFNIYDYLPQNFSQPKDSSITLKERNFSSFKTEFLDLRERLRSLEIKDHLVENLLYQMSSKLSIVCEDPTIVQKFDMREEVNAYFIVASLLKRHFLDKDISLEGKKVSKFLEENAYEYLLSIDASALHDLVYGILQSYYSNELGMVENYAPVDIRLEMDKAFTILIEVPNVSSSAPDNLLEKIFSSSDVRSKEQAKALPKRLKQAIEILKCEIEKIEQEKERIYKITINLSYMSYFIYIFRYIL